MANQPLTGPRRAPETVRGCRPPGFPPGNESNTIFRVRSGHGAQGEDLQDHHRCLQYVWAGQCVWGTGLIMAQERHGGVTIDTPVFELKGWWPRCNVALCGNSSANRDQKSLQVHRTRVSSTLGISLTAAAQNQANMARTASSSWVAL
jgi:hypothetical protein